MHPCEIIYKVSNSGLIYGDEKGTCRITGKESTGIKFGKWVKSTFNDYAYLQPGDIISNEALFCFDEQSDYLRLKTGREKPQRFRTYSHIVHSNNWYCLTKADKKEIFNLIISGAEIVSLTDTGQKHVFFKHKIGFWQLDELFITPDVEGLKRCHSLSCDLLRMGFSQNEIITGEYKFNRIELAGLNNWKPIESELKIFRGTGLFAFATWMLFISDEDKNNIQKMYDEAKSKKAALKNNKQDELKKEDQLCLF